MFNFLESPGFASGWEHDRVPWKQIKECTDYFIEPTDGVPQIEDPSDMKKEQIARLLDHWRCPVSGSDLFKFSHVLKNSKTNETMHALYKDLFATKLSHPHNGAVSNSSTPPSAPPRCLTPVIDPILVLASRTPTPFIDSGAPTPVIDPTPVTPSQTPTPFIGSFPPQAPTPVIDPELGGITSPVGSTTGPEPRPKPTAPSQDPILTTRPEQSRPQPKPRPHPKAKDHPTAPSQDPSPNPNGQIEENLGRSKRIPKRKLDIYLAAEEKIADLAEKK